MGLAAAVIGAGVIGAGASLATGAENSSAAKDASNAQVQSNQQALALQQSMFGTTQANLAPYMSAGRGALSSYMDLIGAGGTPATAPQTINLGGYNIPGYGNVGIPGMSYTIPGTPGVSGADAQTAAINGLKTNPLYVAEMGAGNQNILANAAATGGLRSGNTNYGLGQLGAQTLAQVYQQQIANLGNLAGIGENAAAGVGNVGQNYANSASNILSSTGSAQAGGILGSAGALGGGINGGLSSLLGGITQGLYLNGANNDSAYADVGPVTSVTPGDIDSLPPF